MAAFGAWTPVQGVSIRSGVGVACATDAQSASEHVVPPRALPGDPDLQDPQAQAPLSRVGRSAFLQSSV